MGSGQLSSVMRHIRKLASMPGSRNQTDGQLLERFTVAQDEAAFETLLQRHGPMVLGVCRRLLPDPHDAEDAFQATFLVLLCKAGSIAKRESAGSWLHGVAYRIAVRAKTRAERQRTRVLPLPELPDESRADIPTEAHRRELCADLAEELDRLPEKHRAPLVLCYLEGKSRHEAAQQLGWPEGTVQRRLARGRELLHSRLVRRGLTLSAALAAAELSTNGAPAAVPAALTAATLKAAVLMAAGKGTAAGAVSAQAAALTKAALHALFLTKLKIAAAVMLIIGVAGLGVGTVTQQVLAQRQNEAAAKAEPPRASSAKGASKRLAEAEKTAHAAPSVPSNSEETKRMTVDGRVLDAGGKPVANAHVAVLASPKRFPESGETPVLGRTDSAADGSFQLIVPRTSSMTHYSVRALAGPPGYGADWQEFDPDGERPRVTLHLEREQILRGRLVGLQGEPAGKVKLRVGFLARKDGPGVWDPAGNEQAWWGPLTTDAEGRFVLRGIGENQDVTLKVQDDRFARQELQIPVGHNDRAKEVRFVLAPPRVVTGRITYADSGKPVPAARIQVMAVGGNFYGQTGEDGRYELPVCISHYLGVYATPPKGAPYSIVKKGVEWPKGVVRHSVDLALPRGIPVKGKIVEADSGKPVARAIVQFIPQNNGGPDQREDIASLWHSVVATESDGAFQVILPPGSAHLLVDGPTPDYIHQEVAYSILAEGKINYGRYYPGPEGNAYFGGQRVYAHAVVPLKFQKGTEPEPLRVALRRGVTVRGRVLGADSKPVARARMLSRQNISLYDHMIEGRTEIYDGHFELHGCDPGATYRVIFYDGANQQGAVAEIAAKQADGEPITVRLAPCSSATARVINGGQPIPHSRVKLELVVTPGASGFDGRHIKADTVWISNLDWTRYGQGPRTDGQGRLNLTALIPGATYRFELGHEAKDCTVEAGKTVDWGDITEAMFIRESN
jgi:RNA polymerase sigma factor (sigma-70 family)